MRVLMVLTYYRPHYSGLTIYVERLAKALVHRDHQVCVLTSRFDPALLSHEWCEGVEVRRPWVLMRISKGVIMPTMLTWAWKLIRESDIVNVHVPQLDAAPISVLARLMGKPVVMTYHCDLRLPAGLIHRIANLASSIANQITARAANLIVTNTRDYAEHSRFLRRYLPKVRVVPPVVEVEEVSVTDIETFREKYNIKPDEQVIGMLARLASEKGVEYLVQAMPRVLEHYPKARVLYVGQNRNVLGEEEYASRLAPLISALGDRWQFLGILPPVETASFFQVCDVTVLPSLNSTESFGIVQIESMSSGTPVVATDLPGVRQPVMVTGMGKTVPPADAEALANALISVLDDPESYQGDSQWVKQRFSPGEIAAEYENVFADIKSNIENVLDRRERSAR